ADNSTTKYLNLLVGTSSFTAAILFQSIFAFRFIYFLNLAVNIIVIYIGYQNNFDIMFGNTILANSTRNVVSAYLIIMAVYYIFLCLKFNKNINLLLIIMLSFNCAVLYGRSGVALSIIILLYSLYKR